MKCIFLDVDGTLNHLHTKERTPDGAIGVMESKIKLLKRIIDRTGAKIVLSSDWKLHPQSQDFQYLTEKCIKHGGFELYDCTPDISWERRGLEIGSWLGQHPEVTEWVILDDIPFGDFYRPQMIQHLVLIDPLFGLTEDNVKKAIKILNGELEDLEDIRNEYE